MEEVKASIDTGDYEVLLSKETKIFTNGILALLSISASWLINHNYLFSSAVYFITIFFVISFLLSIKKKSVPDMSIRKKGIIFQKSKVESLIIKYNDIDKVVEKGTGILIFTKDKIYQTDYLKNKSTFLNKLENMFAST